jgi:hypothetical protein
MVPSYFYIPRVSSEEQSNVSKREAPVRRSSNSVNHFNRPKLKEIENLHELILFVSNEMNGDLRGYRNA